MSAGFKAAEDVAVIEALDFQPPCDARMRSPEGVSTPCCDNGAEWAVTYRHHCIDGTTTRLFCDKHLARISSAASVWRCRTCNEITDDAAARIVRTERIGA